MHTARSGGGVDSVHVVLDGPVTVTWRVSRAHALELRRLLPAAVESCGTIVELAQHAGCRLVSVDARSTLATLLHLRDTGDRDVLPVARACWRALGAVRLSLTVARRRSDMDQRDVLVLCCLIDQVADCLLALGVDFF